MRKPWKNAALDCQRNDVDCEEGGPLIGIKLGFAQLTGNSEVELSETESRL